MLFIINNETVIERDSFDPVRQIMAEHSSYLPNLGRYDFFFLRKFDYILSIHPYTAPFKVDSGVLSDYGFSQ